MMWWLLYGIFASQTLAQDAGIKKNQPVLGVGLPISRAPPGELPAGCVISYYGPTFKLAALPLGQLGGGQRLISEEIVLPAIPPPVGKENSVEIVKLSTGGDIRGEESVVRQDLKMIKAFKRQAPPLESDVIVTSRITKTSTATLTVSPGPLPSREGSWPKTVFGATVNQAPNGQVQVVETPFPIVLQTKPAPLPIPFAALPASVPRITQAANGQIQAPREPKAAQRRLDSSKKSLVANGGASGVSQGTILELTLSNGVLKDKLGRTGYLSGARQFQFDTTPQFGAVVSTGFSVCDDGLLALGPSKIFYQCKSGSLFNIYDQKIAGQCEPINLLFFEEYKY